MFTRLPAIALCSAVASWITLGAILGNAGLQRLVSGPGRVLEQPLPMVVAGLVAFAVAFLLARRLGTSTDEALPLAGWMLALDVLAGLSAVVLVGELTTEDAVLTTLIAGSLGTQVFGGALGFWVSTRTRARRRAAAGAQTAAGGPALDDRP